MIDWNSLEKLLPPHDNLGDLVISGLNRFKENECEYTIYREAKNYWEDDEQKKYVENLPNTWFAFVSGSYPTSQWGVCRVIYTRLEV